MKAQSGTWSGDLNIYGNKLPVVFHLEENSPTMDSPAQGAKGIPISFSKSEDLTVSIKIDAIGASFKGTLADNRITGIFSQRGVELPLVLSPGEIKPKRPQTPEPPFPYTQEEMSFYNGDALLKGTLTLPHGYDRSTPVVIMVTGSGLQNRDEELFDHKPFAVIADALARNGIASLRYDDRGFGDSTGDAVNCTTEDLKNDALSGIRLLRERFDHVGTLGHSEGGTIAFMLGTEGKTDFIVSLAGMVISGKETLMDQNRWLLSQAGYPQDTIDLYCQMMSSAFDREDNVVQKIESSALPGPLKQNLIAGMNQIDTPYMRCFLNTDVSKSLEKISCPVLALNGKNDSQVGSRKNLEALRAGLPSGGHTVIKEFEGLNHLFQHCSTGSVNEYATIEETISPEVLETIIGWINTIGR